MGVVALALVLAAQQQAPGPVGEPDVVIDRERAFERGVRPADFQARVRSADRVIVRAGRAANSAVLTEVATKGDLLALAAALDVDASRPAFLCGCPGSPILELHHSGRPKEIVSVHLHPQHETICSQAWTSNAYLRQPAALWNWQRQHGVEASTDGRPARSQGGRTKA